VQSYENALKSEDPAIPAQFIGGKLTAIKRDHPKEYADGMQLTLSPPVPSYYGSRIPAIRGGYFPIPPAPTPAPVPPTLLSPAANTNAAPSPAPTAPAVK
jgi:hypothetical protein